MTINNLDILFYTLIFVVPGFIIDSIYRKCVPQRDITFHSVFLRFLLFSVINYSIVFPIISWLSKIPYIQTHETVSFYISMVTIFLIPVIIALIISVISNKGWVRTILQKIGIHTIHVIPTAWDYQFRKDEHKYLIVYLEDGGIVFGYWGFASFASSIREDKDLYLEKIFNVDDNNEWIEIPQNKGIWIPEKSIKYIEFL
ncbi:DUF6338 family protein [Bacillus sp. FSL W8-0116]|uniref:DUF6338 family protein n=1 Tax=Bacillus sp. FSL W8-0116 TaxID=2978206 RepID=UPI0030F99DCC